MNSLSQYWVEVILGSSVFFLGFLLTRNYLSISFRRFYLLGCLIIPLMLPLIAFNTADKVVTELPQQIDQLFVEKTEESTGFIPQSELNIETAQNNEIKRKSSISWVSMAFYLYSGVCFILLIRFLISLFSIWRLINNPKEERNGMQYYLIDNPHFSGGSFFHHIFINRSFQNDPALDIILTHEQCHSRFWHTLDILVSEFYCIVFWPNPVSWLVRREIKLNAEYEADQFTAMGYDKYIYSDTLLKLSTNTQQLEGIVSFSAMNVRRRINNILGGKTPHWSKSLLAVPFLAIATWLVSCEPEVMDFTTMNPQAALKNVKTVTTRYISHQRDTQQKDGKIIAIAYYLPDGTVDRVEQYMTYPYDYEHPFQRKFLTSPNPAGVLHVLDGFNLGHAENNLLYGNDWPKYNKIEFYRANSEMYRNSTTIDKNDEGLPVKFTLTTELNEDLYYNGSKRTQKGTVLRTHIEFFTYDNNRVISHVRRTESPELVIQYNNQGHNVGGSRLLHEMNYIYEGENLIEVSGQTQGNGSPETTKMEYQNGIMKSSSYYRNNTKYHYREFYYDESGLKTRTEIFNVYGEPEYTITYDYEYY